MMTFIIQMKEQVSVIIFIFVFKIFKKYVFKSL